MFDHQEKIKFGDESRKKFSETDENLIRDKFLVGS